MHRHWSAEDVTTIRDFERFLREAGYSRSEAETLSRRGWDALVEQRRRSGHLEHSGAGLRRFLESGSPTSTSRGSAGRS